MGSVVVIEVLPRGGMGIYVGRPSLLGNPYRLEDGLTREAAIQLYREWLERALREDPRVARRLDQLVERARRTGRLPLVCCAPRPCHAEVIAEEVRQKLEAEGREVRVRVWRRDE